MRPLRPMPMSGRTLWRPADVRRRNREPRPPCHSAPRDSASGGRIPRSPGTCIVDPENGLTAPRPGRRQGSRRGCGETAGRTSGRYAGRSGGIKAEAGMLYTQRVQEMTVNMRSVVSNWASVPSTASSWTPTTQLTQWTQRTQQTQQTRLDPRDFPVALPVFFPPLIPGFTDFSSSTYWV